MKIEIVNKRTNKKVQLDSYVRDSGILITYFNPGEIPSTFKKVKGVNQYGSSLLTTSLEERTVDIEGIILYDTKREVQEMKKDADKILSSLDELLVKVDDEFVSKEISGSMDGTPVYSTDYRTNRENALAFKISIECFNPFWKEQSDIHKSIETWEGGLEFELEIIEEGIEFAKKGPNEVVITNNGDVRAPLEILFNGPALNPKISIGNKFIKVNKQISENETLYIKTNFGDKAVDIIKGEERERAYHYIDPESIFFDLSAHGN